MRTKEEILIELNTLTKRFWQLETGRERQRHILCNKWKMFWLLTELEEYLNNEH